MNKPLFCSKYVSVTEENCFGAAQTTAEHPSTMHWGFSWPRKTSGERTDVRSLQLTSWQLRKSWTGPGALMGVHAPQNIKEVPRGAVVARAGCGWQGRGVCRKVLKEGSNGDHLTEVMASPILALTTTDAVLQTSRCQLQSVSCSYARIWATLCCVRCAQVQELLCSVTELQEEVGRFRSIRKSERMPDYWIQTLSSLGQTCQVDMM